MTRMQRSEINHAIDRAAAFFRKHDFNLPHYALWTPEQWRRRAKDYAEVISLRLGWDVTDFGSGNLRETGRTIFTLRNGRAGDRRYPKTYAHKAMHMPENQKSITHYHRVKREDIHNQAGGNILIALWPVGSGGAPANRPLDLSISGRRARVSAGKPVRIKPGEWICVPPMTYHRFWAENRRGDVLSIEVSSVCDDLADNVFWPGGARFPEITEDEPARYVLCSEYATALKAKDK